MNRRPDLRLALCAAALATLMLQSACTQVPPGSGPSSTSTGPSPAHTGGPLRIAMVTDKGGLGDQSFNDSAYNGLKKAQAELGIEPKVVQSKEEADYKKNLTTCAEGRYDLVVAVGILMTDAVREVAARYPNTRFALIDGDIDNMLNVVSLDFNEQEGSFLAGALSGFMTKKHKVGFIGGMNIPLIVKFEEGYHAGVETTDPKVQFLSGYTNKWDDPGKGKELAESQYNQGVDIIFSAAGACGKGAIEAARDKGPGYWAIGVDSDQDFLGTADPAHPAAPGRVLTSMVKHCDTAVFLTVQDLKSGHWCSGRRVFGLKEDGVSLSDMKYSKDQIPPQALSKVAALRQMIINGQITVPYTEAQFQAFKPPAHIPSEPSPEPSSRPAPAP